LISLSRNFGHQNACIAGLEEALKWRHSLGGEEWIGLADSDMQDDLMDIERLLSETGKNKVVYAIRSKRSDGWIMNLAAPIFYAFLSKTSPFFIPQNAGTFSVMHYRVVEKICEYADNDPYLPGLRAWVGFHQTGIPTSRRKRKAGKSRVGIFGLIRLTMRALVLYSNLPLQLFFYLGIFITLSCALLILFLSFYWAITQGNIDKSDFMILLQLAAFGVNSLLLGLVAHMVSRVKDNTSRQRSWVISEAVTFMNQSK
jgi:dolichol-phosphate mannosyltransferase